MRVTESCGKVKKIGKDKIQSKKDYYNKIEQEKIDQLRSMKLHCQFERDTGEKIRKIMALAQKWKSKKENSKLVVSSIEANLKYQIG